MTGCSADKTFTNWGHCASHLPPDLCGDTPVITNDLPLLLFIVYHHCSWFKIHLEHNFRIKQLSNTCGRLWPAKYLFFLQFLFYIPTFSQHQMHHTNKRNFILSQISHIQKINFLVLQIYFPHKSGVVCWLVFFNSNIINVNSHTQYPCLA